MQPFASPDAQNTPLVFERSPRPSIRSEANQMDQRTDTELLAALRAMIERGEVRLELDAAKLDHMDSPVSVQADSTRWFAALCVACGAAFWFGGWIVGVAALAASIALWFAWVRPGTHRRIRVRVRTVAMDDTQVWRKLWRFGGV